MSMSSCQTTMQVRDPITVVPMPVPHQGTFARIKVADSTILIAEDQVATVRKLDPVCWADLPADCEPSS